MQLTTRSFAFSSAFALTLAFATPALAGGGGGAGGGMATCIDANESCEVCADEQCPTETQACCDATGCKPLVLCLLDNCATSLGSQLALIQCASASCSAEIAAAGNLTGPGTMAAQSLGTCLSGPLQNPPAGACTDCVNGFGGAGGTSAQGGSSSTGGSTGSSTGGSTAGSGGNMGTGGTTSSGTGGNDGDITEDEGCGCRVVGTPLERKAPWAALLGLAGIAVARRRRS